MAESPIQRLAGELKRRKVFRVAGLYAVVAWGVIEVAGTVFPILMLPGWLLTAVTVLALLGFPLTVVLAWALEVTPTGLKRTPERSGGSEVPSSASAATWIGLGLVLALTVGAGYVFLSPSDRSVPVDRSIAVLPFENMSGEAENEHFSDGMTEDILMNLSKIGELRVISRTSVMTYKGSEKTIPEIARELGVAYVLEGSVRRADDQVRIAAQLIRAETDDHLWSESYDRRLTDVFAIQSEIAQAIAQELRTELSAEVRQRIEAAPTSDMQAYESFLKGRGLLDQRTPEPMRQAIDHFQRAVDRDPGYGLAWAGLADAVSLLTWYDYAVPDSVPGPLEAARRAVELDPDLGHTHASLGIAHSILRDGPPARRELERAIELTPGYAEPHSWLGWLLLLLGEPEQAVEPTLRAVELDPLAPAYRVFLAEALLANGDSAEALSAARRAVELQAGYGLAHYMEGLVLYHLGRFSEAGLAMERARSLVPPGSEPSHAEVDAVLTLARLAAGDREAARTFLDGLERGSPDAEFAAGLVHAALGETDRAFDAFRRVESWESFSNEQLRYFFPSALGGIRADPRYGDILNAVDRSWGLTPPVLP